MFRLTSPSIRWFSTTASSVALLLLASTISAQSLFDRIPPLTNGCYRNGDPYWEELAAVQAAIQREFDARNQAQAAVNRAVDPTQQAQRVMAAMQTNPQRAMEVMQRQQTAPAEVGAFLAMSEEREAAFRAERESLLTEFGESLATRVAPIDARIAILSDPGGPSNPNYMADLRVQYTLWDAEYAAHCAASLGPNGRFGQYLDRYRAYLLEEWLPPTIAFHDIAAETLEFFAGVKPTDYPFPGEHEAVGRYIDEVVRCFSWIEEEPREP